MENKSSRPINHFNIISENSERPHSLHISSSFSDQVLGGKDDMEFPADALPNELRSYCEVVSECLCVPIEFVAVAGLYVCAVANGGRRRFQNGPYLNLSIFWNLILADTGKQKSPPQKIMMKPLFDRDLLSQKYYKEAMAKYLHLDKNERREIEMPSRIQFLLSDTTSEAVNLQHSWNERLCGGVGIYSDEITKYLGSLGKYNKANDSEVAARLERYSNSPIVVNRVGNGDYDSSYIVSNSPENLLGGHQPALLYKILNKESTISGDGFRYNFFYPEDYKKYGFPKEIPQEKSERYQKLVDSIFNFDVVDAYSSGFKITPHIYSISTEGNEILKIFKEENDRIHNESSPGHYLRGIEGKVVEKACRNALLFQAIDDAALGQNQVNVSLENMKRGIELAKYHFFSSIRVSKEILNRKDELPSKSQVIRHIAGQWPNINRTQLAELLKMNRVSVQKIFKP